jgi:hypothetical protein
MHLANHQTKRALPPNGPAPTAPAALAAVVGRTRQDRRPRAQPISCHRPSASNFTIRDISAADVPKLASIEQQCREYSACWSAADIEAELSNSLSRAAVAADAETDDALGYIVCWLVAGELQVCECLHYRLACHAGQYRLLLNATAVAPGCDTSSMALCRYWSVL